FNYAIRGTLYDLNRIKFKRYWRLAYLFNSSGNYIVDNLKVIAPEEPKYKLKNFSNALKTEGVTLFDFPVNTMSKISEDLAEYVGYMEHFRDKDSIEKLKATFEYIKARQINAKGGIISEEVISILELLDMIINEGGCTNIDEFLYEVNYRNQRLHGHAENRDLTIQLTTVHDFKGKEADSVYIWKDTDKMFPSERSTESDYEE